MNPITLLLSKANAAIRIVPKTTNETKAAIWRQTWKVYVYVCSGSTSNGIIDYQ